MNSELRTVLTGAMQLALQRHQSGDLAGAEALYAQILSAAPDHLVALRNLSLIWVDRGNIGQGLALLAEGIRYAPNDPTLRYARGVVLQNAGQLEGAIDDYHVVLAVQPNHHHARENLGVALQDTAQYDAAATAYRQALAVKPNSKIAWRNLINVLRALQQPEAALAAADQALAHHPADGDFHMLRGTTLLALGRLSEGWSEFEWRYVAPEQQQTSQSRKVPLPKWDGRALPHGGLVLYGEQGLGDEIMFASCVAEAARAAQDTWLECDPRLVPLFARSFPHVHVVARTPENDYGWLSELQRVAALAGDGHSDEPSAQADCALWRLATASLPGLLRNSEADFKSGAPYLAADPALAAAWKTKLDALGPGLRVGISWRGGAEARARLSRSLPLALWQPLFAVAGVHLISLQYGDHRAEIEEFNRGQTRPLIVFDELDPLRELEQFAAAVSALDLVLSIDNSTVHLAGALGVPTWALLPAHADYRWMTERTDSPWYAAVRLWRQQDARDPATWNALLTEIAQALAGYKPAPRAEVTASGLPLPPQWENAEAKAAALPRADLAPSGLPLPPQWDNAEVRAAASPRAEVAPAGLPLPPQWERVGVRATAFPRALLLNDTSYWYHWGCTCTSLALHEQLRARGLRVSSLHIGDILQRGAAPPPAHPAAFDDADVYAQFAQRHSAAINALQSADLVVVNGEGTLHGLSHGALSLLYLAYIAKTRLGKPVHVINHSCYPSSEPAHLAAATALYAHAYRVFDSVAVREPLSAENVRAFGVEPIAAFDSLPLYLAAHPLPAVAKQDTLLIAGSVAWSPAMLDALAGAARIARKQGLRVQVLVGANASLAADDVSFVQALHARLNGAYELVATHNETQWLTAIAQARLLVSGRFHHSIAAACVGTPFLLGDSNTAKIDGLLQMLELPAEQVRFVAGTSIDKQVHALLARREAGLIRPATRARLIALGRENFRYSF